MGSTAIIAFDGGSRCKLGIRRTVRFVGMLSLGIPQGIVEG